MAQRKIQLLRSTTVYESYADAYASLNLTLATQAQLSDGELVLARYKETVQKIGGSEEEVIKSILAVYNNKANLNGFTILTNEDEINKVLEDYSQRISELETALDSKDVSFNVVSVQDTNVPQETDDESIVVTAIAQENGQVYVGGTATKDLLLTGYVKTNSIGDISANDTIENALSKLENNIGSIDVDIHSNDGTINVSDDATNGGKNIDVNIDYSTIVLNASGEISSGLTIAKTTDKIPTNVKEQYVLQDSEGNEIGEAINVYKDSSLKEVYLGTQWDTVNEETGVVRHILFIINDANVFISEETYNSLTENEKSVYQSVHAYAINRLTVTAQEYASLSDDAKELYTLSDDIYIAKERYISESDYNQLPSSAQAEYSATFDMAYEIKDEWRYLTEEEFTEKFSDEEGSFYHYIASQNPSLKNKDYWQNLNFVYILDDGTYSLVKVDLNKFLSEVEYGRGLYVNDNGRIEVSIGQGLGFKTTIGVKNIPIEVVIDPSSDSSLSLTQYGLKLDTTTLLSNTLTQVNGSEAISVSQRQNNQQDIELVLAGAENGIDNALEIISSAQNEGLYLASTWDCGEY